MTLPYPAFRRFLLPVFVCAVAGAASYHDALRAEFSAVGPARFTFGGDEKQTVAAIETGGGMERFFKVGPDVTQRGETWVEGRPFSLATTFSIKQKPGMYWERSFRLSNTLPVRKGETLLAVFWAKGVKAPQIVDDGAGATLQAYFQAGIGKFPKGRVNNFYDCKMLGTEWQRYTIKTAPLTMDFPPGTLSFVGMFGHKAQTIEVGGLAVMAFPESANLDALPKPDWNYPGRAPDAPWRAEAEKRIDQHRRGNLTITVADADGNPVPNVGVGAVLQRHAFNFGVAVRVGTFHGRGGGMTPADVEKYKEISTKYYSGVVVENSLKWGYFESGRATGWRDTKQCLEFYKQHDMRLRGHVLVWPTIYRTPEPIRTQFAENPGQMGGRILAHVTEEATEFRPWITDWDVTNETDVNRDFMDKLGPQAMVGWYKAARQAAPDALLTFNEPRFGAAGMEIGSFPENLLSKDCRGWVDYLIKNNAPLDTLGSQCHGGAVTMDYEGRTGAEALWAYYDHLASYYGKKLQYTELDVHIGDPSDPAQSALQADKLRDTLIIAFAHPAFIGATQWGFWAGSHYVPNAALWNRDWTPRPAAEAYLDLVTNRWHTAATLTTGADGTCTLRAFHGSYKITLNGRDTLHDFPSGDQHIRLTLP